MTIDNIAPEQQEKAKAAKTADEIAEIAHEKGTDLVDEELRVSGGNGSSYCEEDMFCRQDGLYCQQDRYCRDLA